MILPPCNKVLGLTMGYFEKALAIESSESAAG